MVGSEFKSPEGMLAAIRGLTNAISREELDSVFSRMGKKIGGTHPDWRRVCFVRRI
jgi:hypothetical protein